MRKIRRSAAIIACGLFASVSYSQSFLPQPKQPVPPVKERAAAPSPAPTPRLEPIADAKMLMVAMCQPNFQGLGKRLAEKPADAETWTIVRGQSLIVWAIAEGRAAASAVDRFLEGETQLPFPVRPADHAIAL